MPISMFGFQSALGMCSSIMHLIQLGHACMYMPDAILNLEEHQGRVLNHSLFRTHSSELAREGYLS